jgi:hypothetical protein
MNAATLDIMTSQAIDPVVPCSCAPVPSVIKTIRQRCNACQLLSNVRFEVLTAMIMHIDFPG